MSGVAMQGGSVSREVELGPQTALDVRQGLEPMCERNQSFPQRHG